MIRIPKLISHLRSVDCSCCPAQATCENMDGIGCLPRDAADVLELLSKLVGSEKKSCFRLGQADMRDRVTALLQEAAGGTTGSTHITLVIAADLVRSLEVRNDI